MFEQVDTAASFEPVDHFVREFADPRRKALDLTRYEGPIDEIAQARMFGRLKLQQRMAFDIEERLQMRRRLAPAELLSARHMQNLPPEAPVAQQRGDLRMAGEAPESVLLPKECRRRGADGAISGIGIIEEGGFARIKRHAASVDVDIDGHRPAGPRKA